MKNIVVLGATGHIGAYTFEYLAKELDTSEYGLIASGRRNTSYYISRGYQYINVDICKSSDFNKLPQENVYAVILLAGIMPASMKGYNPYSYIDINIRGSLNVLEYCRKTACKKIITTTTEADLSGYWKPGVKLLPDLPPRFDRGSNYAMYIISRLAVIEMLNNYHVRYGIAPFVLRCSTVYCYTESPYMYKLGKRIVPGYIQIDIELWGNPLVKTDIVYVKDFAQIVEKALIAENHHSGIYNIGTGMPVTLEDQIKIAIDVLGTERKRSKILYRPDMQNGRDFCMDIDKTCTKLGYCPKYDYRSYLVDYKKEMELNRFHGLFATRSEE